MAFRIDKRKTLEAAAKYAQRNYFDKALVEYQKLLSADPNDTHVRLRIGDLYLRKRESAKAIQAYAHVAGQLSQKGFDAKAAAIYKQILRIDPGQVDARVQLGELHQRQGLVSDALHEFEKAAEQYRQKGQRREAFALLRRVAALDPTNIANRLGLADLLFREGMVEEATQEYHSLIRDVEAEDQPDELAHVAEQMLEQFPSDPEAFQALVAGKVACEAPGEAIERLSKLMARHAGNVEVREALVRAYEAAGDSAAVQGLYREIAEIYKERGDVEHARDILQRHVSLDPLSGPDAQTPPSIELTDEFMDNGQALGFDDTEGEELELGPEMELSPEMELGPEMETGSEFAPEGESIPLSGEPPDVVSVEDLIAEAKVALEFGDLDDAEARASEALEQEPASDEARAVLAEAHAQKGDVREAIRLTVERRDLAASVAEGDLLSEIEAKLRDYQRREPESSSAVAHEELPDVEIELVSDGDQDSRAASVEPPPGLREPRSKASSPPPQIEQPPLEPAGIELEESECDETGEALAEAEFYVEQGMLDEAERILQSVLERSPNHPQALARLGEISAARGSAPDEVAADRPSPHLEETVVQPQPRERRKRPSTPIELSPPSAEVSVDSEAEASGSFGSEIELDLEGDSQATASPEHREISFELELDDLDEAPPQPEPKPEPKRELKRKPEPKPEPVTPKPSVEEPAPEPEPVAFELDLDDLDEPAPEIPLEENPFDLAAELEAAIVDDETQTGTSLSGLDDTLTSGGPGFRQVFGAFKRAIEEQVGEGESQAHYDLGIAYREMGLIEDAIGEFELASRAEGRRVEALALLGACKIDAGQPREALKDLEQALRLAGSESEAALPLRYERGRALAACGETERALEEYRQVHRAAPEFRDVADRVAELESGRS